MTALARWRRWALSGADHRPSTTDRLFLIALALGALKVANFQSIAPTIPGLGSVYASDAVEFICYLAFVVLIALSCRRTLPAWIRRWRPGRCLILAPVVLLLVGGSVLTLIGTSLPNDTSHIDDANAMAVCGAQAITAGRNPYHVDELSCLRQLGVSVTLATPLRVGSLKDIEGYPTPAQIDAVARAAGRDGDEARLFSGLAKPPLDAVVMVPVAHAPSQVRALWTLLAAAVFAVLLGIAAGPLWAAALAAFFATYFIPGSALNFASFGNGESVAYLLMALSVLWIRRPVVSAVCMGLALGSNELALFLLPGYLLISLSLAGRSRRAVALLGTLVVAVVPWLVAYPDALTTVWRNLSSPTFPLGYGPVLLVLQKLVRPISPNVFLGATAGTMALTLFWGWRRPVWRVSAGVLLIAAFWLSWRSLDEYMAQVPLLALAAIIGLLARPGAETGPGEPGLGGTDQPVENVPPQGAQPTGAPP